MPFVERWVHKFQIKPNSWVFVPSNEAVGYGKKVKKIIESHWSCPSYYFHLKDGGHVKALCAHVDNSYFSHLDIKDFFGCINKSRVTRCLKEFLSYENARKIAVESTVKLPDSKIEKYILPFGFVQSPIIASICLSKSRLGNKLNELHRSKNIIVSVYMDDIIISGTDCDCMIEVLKDIRESSERSNFPLNNDKEQGPSEKITAFNIELSHNLLEITKDRMKKFEFAYLHAENNDQREGILGYISSVNGDQAEKIIALKY